jgi:hypothetical protein
MGKWLPWNLLRIDMTQQGHQRVMRITHLPTGVAVRTRGEEMSWARMRRALLPELAVRVARKLGHEEPPVNPPTLVRLENRAAELEAEAKAKLKAEKREARRVAKLEAGTP